MFPITLLDFSVYIVYIENSVILYKQETAEGAVTLGLSTSGSPRIPSGILSWHSVMEICCWQGLIMGDKS